MSSETKILKALLKSLGEIVSERKKTVKSPNCKDQFTEEEIDEIKFVTMVLGAWRPVLSRAIKSLEEEDQDEHQDI